MAQKCRFSQGVSSATPQPAANTTGAKTSFMCAISHSNLRFAKTGSGQT
jgi:hypothetical protein